MLHSVPCALTSCLAGQAPGGIALFQAAKKNHAGNAKVQECVDLLLFGRVRVRVVVATMGKVKVRVMATSGRSGLW